MTAPNNYAPMPEKQELEGLSAIDRAFGTYSTMQGITYTLKTPAEIPLPRRRPAAIQKSITAVPAPDIMPASESGLLLDAKLLAYASPNVGIDTVNTNACTEKKHPRPAPDMMRNPQLDTIIEDTFACLAQQGGLAQALAQTPPNIYDAGGLIDMAATFAAQSDVLITQIKTGHYTDDTIYGAPISVLPDELLAQITYTGPEQISSPQMVANAPETLAFNTLRP